MGIDYLLSLLPLDKMEKSLAETLVKEGETVMLTTDENGSLRILAGTRKIKDGEIVFSPVRVVTLKTLLIKNDE